MSFEYDKTGFSIYDCSFFSIKTAIQAATSIAFGAYAGHVYKSLSISPFQGAIFCGIQFMFQKIALQYVRTQSDSHAEEDNSAFKLRTAIHIVLPMLISPNFTQWLLSSPISWTSSLGIPLVTAVAIGVSEIFCKAIPQDDEESSF